MTTRFHPKAALLALLAVVVQWAGPSQAGCRHRHIRQATAGPVFDRRPALSQATVGALSLDILATGAAETLAAEDQLYGWPRFGYPLPPLEYGAQ